MTPNDSGGTRLMVATLGELGQIIFESGQDEYPPRTYAVAAWSLDNKQIALILGDNPTAFFGSRVILVDIESRQVSEPLTLPDLSIDHVAWSSDGKKLLLGSRLVWVLNLESGVLKPIFEDFTGGFTLWALSGGMPGYDTEVGWLPNGDGVIYLTPFSYGNYYGEVLSQLWIRRLGERPKQLLTMEQLAALDLNVEESLSIKLSPTGTYLALADISIAGNRDSTLVVLDFTTLQSKPVANQAVPRVVAQWELPGAIVGVQWSPDEQALAFLMVTDRAQTIEVLSLSQEESQTVVDFPISEDLSPKDRRWFTWLFRTGMSLISWMP